MKDMLGPAAIRAIADAGKAASLVFNAQDFVHAATAGLTELSIMERVRHIADALAVALPDNVPQALSIIRAMGPHLTGGFQAIAVSEYAARFGLSVFDDALSTISDLTRYGSGEFAARTFLAADPERTLAHMQQWARSSDEHVRRLASEGSRPRLPWAARVPALKADPTFAASILETLKADSSRYVRKSVANHLNDITKERPDWVLDLLSGWSQHDKGTKWIVRHALRSLVKAGNARAMALVGAEEAPAVEVLSLSVTPSELALGDDIVIEAVLASRAEVQQKLVVDYRLHYVRAGGKTTAKVFKMKTFSLVPGATVTISVRQSIRDFSTRRHYPGIHRIELLVNGRSRVQSHFKLMIL